MIPRYTRPQMGRIWEDQNKYQRWLDVELAVVETLADGGIIPKDAAAEIKARAAFSVDRINEIEAEVKHDVIAFTTSVAEYVGPASRYFHYGLTSSDVLDTALALQVADASAVILEDLERLLDVLKKRAYEFKTTVMVGRTHGIHAEPTTFGLKLALFHDEVKRQQARFNEAVETMRVGKLSGAVGTFAHFSPDVEETVMRRLNLRAAPASSQIIQRDRHAHYITSLALMGSTLEKIAVELRHLQRTEVREAEEFFSEKQKGSSAMPHKRNPITSEQIAGLSRILRSNALAAMEDVALWHERDISHSSVERIIFPDSTILADYLLDRTATLIEKLVVYPERMKENLELTHGLIYSGELLLALVARNVAREDAYRWVQRDAMRVWDEGGTFKEKVLSDADIRRALGAADIERVFDSTRLLSNVDRIFQRVFG
ncbi:MAG: adenylosuccinate lyase [Acidobacteria bacterium 13_1_40CM_3_56_11]|nr:MAG: adenylosuccinate lyase [Acidobacteria bacterium 13_1_40CM_3_56_11]